MEYPHYQIVINIIKKIQLSFKKYIHILTFETPCGNSTIKTQRSILFMEILYDIFTWKFAAITFNIKRTYPRLAFIDTAGKLLAWKCIFHTISPRRHILQSRSSNLTHRLCLFDRNPKICNSHKSNISINRPLRKVFICWNLNRARFCWKNKVCAFVCRL